MSLIACLKMAWFEYFSQAIKQKISKKNYMHTKKTILYTQPSWQQYFFSYLLQKCKTAGVNNNKNSFKRIWAETQVSCSFSRKETSTKLLLLKLSTPQENAYITAKLNIRLDRKIWGIEPLKCLFLNEFKCWSSKYFSFKNLCNLFIS